MSAHELLACSAAPQWGHCSGSIAASFGAPQVETVEDMAGTATHWVCASCLEAFKGLNDLPLLCNDYIGMAAPNGVIIDDAMAEGAQIYVDDVLEVAQEHGAVQQLLVERRVHSPQIHAENGGTLDAGLALSSGGYLWRIYNWDYKNGHSEVPAFENLQAVNYIAGLVAELKIDRRLWPTIEVIIRIVHPFCYSVSGSVSEWRIMLSELEPYFNQLREKAAEAFTDPKLTTGAHCRYCKGLIKCEPGRKKLHNLFDYVNAPLVLDDMDACEMATELQLLKDGDRVARRRIEALEQVLEHRIKGGDTSSGLFLEPTYGRAKWSESYDRVVAIAHQFGVNASQPSLRTPTQTIAAARAAVRPQFKQLVDTMSAKAPGGMKLIQANDSKVAAAFKRK